MWCCLTLISTPPRRRSRGAFTTTRAKPAMRARACWRTPRSARPSSRRSPRRRRRRYRSAIPSTPAPNSARWSRNVRWGGLSYIELGVAEGARVAHGGKRALAETGGFYIEPTILDGATNAMRIAQEEDIRPHRRRHSVRDGGGGCAARQRHDLRPRGGG